MSADSVIAIMLGLLSTILAGVFLRRIAKMEKKADERHKNNINREILLCTHRMDESVLLLEVVQAVQKGKVNGELTKAKEQFEKTNKEYDKFVMTQASIHLAQK